MQKLRSVQVLRAVAASAVVFLHAYPGPNEEIVGAGYGAAGVDLFFVISGFIMANVSVGRTAGGFLRDRLWRIYPVWWVAVLPWFFMPRTSYSLFSSLSLWPVVGGSYVAPALGVGWTLTFELVFYAGMTLAIATRAAVPLLFYGACLVGTFTTNDPTLHILGSPMALEFLMGVVVARLPRRNWLGLLVPFGLALMAMTSPLFGKVDAALEPGLAIWRASEWGIPAAMILWGALSLEKLFAHRAFDVPVKIGDASYSVYLFHPLVTYGVDLPWVIELTGAIGFGWIMHLLVERRIISAGKRLPAFGSIMSRKLARAG